MKKISFMLILCIIITSFSVTSFAGIYDSYEGIQGSISTTSLTNIYPGDDITITISVDKEDFTQLVSFDIVGSLTNLTVDSIRFLPSNRPAQLLTTSTTEDKIDFSGFYLPTETAISPTGNSFRLAEIKLTADAAGSASIKITDGFAQFGHNDESLKRKVEFDDVTFTVKRESSGGGGSGSGGGSGTGGGGSSTITPPPVVDDPADKEKNDPSNTDNNTDHKKDEELQQWQNPFTDVKDTDWYYASVEYANKNNLMRGVTENTFSPNTSVTRAMFVTVLYRMEGEPDAGESTFNDVPKGAYYEKAVAWASANKIVNGVTEDSFAPDNNITREQMAAIVYRYASFKNADLSKGENTNILSYTDFSDISEYAIPAFQYMAGEGIMKGETESTLNPKNLSTRAQAATVFMRVMEKLAKK